tara:strand:+ start:70975 stop:71796 length:822 start_codon:yes stop_codon:yes gene_type:complete
MNFLRYLLTFILGKLADSQNNFVKNVLINIFIKLYAPNLKEAVFSEPDEYQSYNDFFIRKLKKETRPINTNLDVIVSPVDGEIIDFGKITKDKLIQAKKYKYSVHDLIGEEFHKLFENGSYTTIYLAPRDYHRIHAPLEGQILYTNHIGNHLYPVNTKSQYTVPSLYIKNERGVIIIRNKNISYALVCIGAMVVGNIVPFWSKKNLVYRKDLIDCWKEGPEESKKNIIKGQEIAHFKMGSTVILIIDNDKYIDSNLLELNKSVKFGSKLIKIK